MNELDHESVYQFLEGHIREFTDAVVRNAHEPEEPPPPRRVSAPA
jgi:hypothetical protein